MSDVKVACAPTVMPLRPALEQSDGLKRPGLRILPVLLVMSWPWSLGVGVWGMLEPVEFSERRPIPPGWGNASSNFAVRAVCTGQGQAIIWAGKVLASSAQAVKKTEALHLMRDAADAEDATENLPVSPGRFFPAANTWATCCSSNMRPFWRGLSLLQPLRFFQDAATG